MSKLRIMQQGGGLIYTPFIPEQQAVTTSSSKDTSSDSESKIDALDKEILSLMKNQDLLPSDIDYITNQLIKFQKKASSLSALGDYSSAMPGMLQILGAVQKAKFFKDQSNSIATKMAQENAGSEFAMDGNGLMYVVNRDTKQLNKIRPTEFDANKYSPMSNSELLYYRQIAAPNDSTIFSDLKDLVGMGSVIKEVDRIIKEYGTTENVAMLTKDAAAKKVILDANSPDGIYKVTKKYTSGDLRTAWKSILRQLPKNMQNLLGIRAAVSGVSTEEYLGDIVLRNTDERTDVSYDASASKAAGFDVDPNKTSTEQLTEMPYLMQIGNLKGKRTFVSIAPRAAKINDTAMITATAFTYGVVKDKDGKNVEMTSLSDALNRGSGFDAGDPETVVFGNKLLNRWEQDAVMFDDRSNFTVVMLPFKEERGHKVPDFEKLDNFNKLQKIINDNPNMSKLERIEEARKLNIDSNEFDYDPETNVVLAKNTMAFLSVHGYAGDNTIDFSDENTKFLEKIDKSEGEHLKDYYNNMIKSGKLRPAKKGNTTINGYSTSGKKDFWSGNIFIPMDDAYYAMLHSGKGEYIPKTALTNYSGRVAARAYEVASQQYTRSNDPDYEKNRLIGQFSNE